MYSHLCHTKLTKVYLCYTCSCYIYIYIVSMQKAYVYCNAILHITHTNIIAIIIYINTQLGQTLLQSYHIKATPVVYVRLSRPWSSCLIGSTSNSCVSKPLLPLRSPRCISFLKRNYASSGRERTGETHCCGEQSMIPGRIPICENHTPTT